MTEFEGFGIVLMVLSYTVQQSFLILSHRFTVMRLYVPSPFIACLIKPPLMFLLYDQRSAAQAEHNVCQCRGSPSSTAFDAAVRPHRVIYSLSLSLSLSALCNLLRSPLCFLLLCLGQQMRYHQNLQGVKYLNKTWLSYKTCASPKLSLKNSQTTIRIIVEHFYSVVIV